MVVQAFQRANPLNVMIELALAPAVPLDIKIIEAAHALTSDGVVTFSPRELRARVQAEPRDISISTVARALMDFTRDEHAEIRRVVPGRYALRSSSIEHRSDLLDPGTVGWEIIRAMEDVAARTGSVEMRVREILEAMARLGTPRGPGSVTTTLNRMAKVAGAAALFEPVRWGVYRLRDFTPDEW